MIKKTFGLAACGVMTALAAAGCSSGSGGSPATAPPWAKTLGPGVTVTDSRTAKAGDGSPAGVSLSLLKDVQTEHFLQMCALYEPSLQSGCESAARSMSTADYASGMPTFKDHVPSYTAIEGDRALLGATGSVCLAGSCTTNTDPAALFDSGRSFSTLWQAPTNGSSSNQGAYALVRLIRVNGTWYLAAST